jgi:hypothetical protein
MILTMEGMSRTFQLGTKFQIHPEVDMQQFSSQLVKEISLSAQAIPLAQSKVGFLQRKHLDSGLVFHSKSRCGLGESFPKKANTTKGVWQSKYTSLYEGVLGGY